MAFNKELINEAGRLEDKLGLVPSQFEKHGEMRKHFMPDWMVYDLSLKSDEELKKYIVVLKEQVEK